MLSAQEKKFLTSTLPFWGKLNKQEQSKILNSTISKSYSPGECLHNGPEDCSGLFIVMEGQVRVYIFSETGKEITLYRLLDRDACIFSASCILKDITFDVYMDAEKETKTLLIPTRVYKELTTNSIVVSEFTNQLISQRFSDVMWVMEQVMFVKMDKRVAGFLLDQSILNGNNLITMTHETIARNLGTAREVITRMLKYLQTDGIVSLSRKGILIEDTAKLRALAE